MSVSVSLHPCQHLELTPSYFGHSDRSVVMAHYGFNCIFFMANDAEHLFMKILAAHISSICPYSNWNVCFLSINVKVYFMYLDKSLFVIYVICKSFLLVYSLPFHFNRVFHRAKF